MTKAGSGELDAAGLEAAVSDFQKRTGGFSDEDDRIEIAAIIRAYLALGAPVDHPEGVGVKPVSVVTVTAPCPCCGQPMTVAKPDELAQLPMSITELTILRRLIKAYPDSVGTDVMQDHVYHGVSAPPISAVNIISITMKRLRGKLNRHGWTVPTERGGRGNHGRYRLMKLEGDNAPA